jgi:hypothetical protein
MTAIVVEFCDGCGRVYDRFGPQRETGPWVDLHLYQETYGFTWEDVELSHTACPECRRLFEIAQRRHSSRAAGAAP